jgi:hypothetical protein
VHIVCSGNVHYEGGVDGVEIGWGTSDNLGMVHCDIIIIQTMSGACSLYNTVLMSDSCFKRRRQRIRRQRDERGSSVKYVFVIL